AAAKRDLWQDFADPSLLNAGLIEQSLADSLAPKPNAPPPDTPSPNRKPDEPAEAFLNWLKAIVSADKSGIKNTADQMQKRQPSISSTGTFEAKDTSGFQSAPPTNADWADPVAWMQSKFDLKSMDASFLQSLVDVYTQPDRFASHLKALAEKVDGTIPTDG